MFGPNISGHSGEALRYADTFIDGAFSKSTGSATRELGWYQGDGAAQYQAFDASISNSIYGTSSVAQPASMQVMPLIKF